MMSSLFDQYALPAAVTIAGMHQLLRFTKNVGEARRKYSVKVPDITGPPEFIRVFRAHQNTLELYPVSLTSLWIGSVFFHPVPASAVYFVYLIGRQRYFKGYVENVENRIPGFYLSLRCLIGLTVMCILGTGHKLVRYYGGIDLFQLLQENLPKLH
ncbi:unnamed protein product [Lymnaea stagnalis]|uniref:Microsomal glutathione S-transferase 2 n=1 Tax=Lymnaea stagnalis TaxID=6523 RepID=A0AAV2IC82_LYMST